MKNLPINVNFKTPELPTNNLVAVSGAINWVWYHQYEIKRDYFNRKLWARPIAADRLHRSDDSQGAADHPDPARPDVWTLVNIDRRPDYGAIKAFGVDVIQRWVSACKELGVEDGECGAILTISKDGETARYPIRFVHC